MISPQTFLSSRSSPRTPAGPDDEGAHDLSPKGNVFWETSAWGPSTFLSRSSATSAPAQGQIMFGSDYPSLTHKRFFEGWSNLDMPTR